MPKPAQITQWRYRRQRRRRRGVGARVRLLSVLALVLFIGLFSLLAAGVLGVTAVYAYFTEALPEFAALESRGQNAGAAFETTKIYAWGDEGPDGQRDPVLIYEIFDPLGGNRQWLKLEQIPQSLIDATVAFEDSAFWTDGGFDLLGLGRVPLNVSVQGSSSITRQVIKNNLVEPEPRPGEESGLDDLRRQIEEVLLAHRAANTYTREQILEWYLNTNYYGNLAYGVEAAARVYFDKPAAKLTLAEATLLAAIPQSPALNPIDNPEAAKERQELVLEAMVREGALTPETAAIASRLPVAVAPGIGERFDIIAPHFALAVQKELEARFGPELLLSGGLRVYTTLDLALQRQAECVARAHIARLSGEIGAGLPADERASCAALEFLAPLASADAGIDHRVNNAAVIMLDPRTAEVKAMVGSLNYWDTGIDGSFNVAVNGRRQPGSAFTPFTYLTALSQGYTAATMVLDVPTDFGTPINGVPYIPQNNDGQFHGPMRLRQALGSDYNVPAVQVMSWVGVDKVVRTARNLGIATLEPGAGRYGLSLTLGGGAVSLLDLVYAFSVIDNMGVMVGQPRAESEQRPGDRTLDPVTILRVEDPSGNVLYEYNQPQRREILTPQLAFLMNDVLAARAARCAGFGCPNVLELPNNRPAAVKTGTTNDFRDAWTVGYTPQLVTGVWVGNSDNSVMDNVSGSKGAAPIWQALMSWALRAEPVEVWPRPPELVELTVCNVSGLLPTSHCPTVSELFIEGTEPTIYDNIYQELAVNRETGRLATLYTPPELIETKVYRVYPEEAAGWARENGIEQPPTEYDTITGPPTTDDNVAILSPPMFAFVNNQVVISGTVRGDDFDHYRLAYFKGFHPSNLHTIADNITEPQENGALGVWNVENLSGLHTLLLTLVREDGSFEEASVHVTIDNTPPTVEIISPLPNQDIAVDEESIVVQAQAGDDVSIERVEFYLDNAGVPFAISTTPPFSERWTIRETGCHSFKAIAVDAAGNQTESAAVPICLLSRD